MSRLLSMNRFAALAGVAVLAIVSLLLVAWSKWFLLPAGVFAGLTALGLFDLSQTSHAILRNYPVIGHMRFLFEGIRPEIRQYLIESDQDEEPFSRDMRSIVYQRAKGVEDKRPFGTRQRVYDAGYAWLTHSIRPVHIANTDFRVKIGGPACSQPYDASLYNISAMSFGALSANAILALNTGAKAGGFAHDTGEGGISRYHRQGGGDLIYEIGSGYFGCRAPDGRFDPDRFTEERAEDHAHRMAFQGFGGGVHKCIGMHFARTQVRAIFQELLRTYKWSVPDDYTWPLDLVALPFPRDRLPVTLKRLP